MTMLSEDRRRFGIIPVRSVRENVTISSLRRFIHGGRLHAGEEDAAVSRICERMNVKTPSLDTMVEALSGGNQQKVVLAKWMLSDPDILIMDEPTRGIDVGAKYEIYKLWSRSPGKEGLVMVRPNCRNSSHVRPDLRHVQGEMRENSKEASSRRNGS
jgi:inositol transport system ATP-binding protein